jgi:hydrogenase maturation protein HypF
VIQHHHAHFAACLAEHSERGPAIGLIFDGLGLGTDGVFWGGEILFGELDASARIGHLRQVSMPGGEAAVREPWRMACAWLTEATASEPPVCSTLRDVVDAARWRAIARLCVAGARAPLTTSVGRLLDACAAICGIGARVTYEGEAAIRFEAIADPATIEAYPVRVSIEDDTIVIDPREMIRSVARDADAGRSLAETSACTHLGLVRAARMATQIASMRTGVRTVALSGGVFQNVLMVERLSAALARDGFRVLVPRRLPLNDGGLAYGQAVAAVWRRRFDVPCNSRSDR